MVERIDDVVIVGAGLSGLAVARFLKEARPEWSIKVIEKGERPGGAIRSHAEGGFQAEWGAHGFLDNCDQSLSLIALAGLGDEVVRAPLSRFVRYICLGGLLRMIPQHPMKIIRANILPLSAKLRILADVWKKPVEGEPSVAEWAARRFGPAVLPFVDAVFTGTFAGDMHRLSIDGVMPGLRELEKQHGSVIRGLLKKAREKKKQSAPRRGLPAMISFRRGMERLPQALAVALRPDEELFHKTLALAINRDEQGWELRCEFREFHCRHLVLALPVNAAFKLLAGMATVRVPPLAMLPEARILTVALGFGPHADVPFGFGYLAPERERRFCLGALFSSHMFPGRAPERGVLLEALVGGRRHPERLELDDKALVEAAYHDLRELIFLPDPPIFSRVLRPRGGIPQLEAGYPALLDWRCQTLADHPGLHLTGFGWGGIGINDMVKGAGRVAEAILADSGRRDEAAQVKPVYF